METSQSLPSQSLRRPSDVVRRRSAEIDESLNSQTSVIEKPLSLSEEISSRFNGNEGAGFGISFVVHVVLLMILAVPVFESFEADEGFTTLVENSTDEYEVIFDAPLDTIVATPDASSAEDTMKSKIFNPESTVQDYIPELKVDSITSVKGEGNGAGSDGNLGGGRVAEPDNAVKAGNFSVWNWPILPGKIQGKLRYGTPGDSPKVRQNYFIVIRVKVPENKQFVRLSDFSGSVIGTDGYRQKIPDDAYFFRSNGDLMKARSNMRMPVLEGTAEILIQVPGAGFADVKDTITVYSRILDEEQEIDLVFKARD